MDIRVDSYEGYRGEEAPRNIWFEGRKIEVIKVLDRCLSPYHRYFKILGNDNALYILHRDMTTLNWELALFEQKEE